MALVLKNICPYCGTETVKLLLLDGFNGEREVRL